MPVNALVTLRYGPYESCGIVDHRTFRLDGLQGNHRKQHSLTNLTLTLPNLLTFLFAVYATNPRYRRSLLIKFLRGMLKE